MADALIKNSKSNTSELGGEGMDYKLVIEEQIRGLQKRQDELKNKPGSDMSACEIATTIAELAEKASELLG